MLFLQIALTGWVAALLFLIAVCIPYVRRMPGGSRTSLRPHYWLGVLIPTVAFVHAWIPMSVGRTGTFNRTGLLIATGTLFAMLWQIILGMILRDSTGTERKATRRLHFATMVLIANLLITHIALNRA